MFPKPARGSNRARRQQADAKAERAARKAARLLYGEKCIAPGCLRPGRHWHHIKFRSTSPELKWDPRNLVPLCWWHHEGVHVRRDVRIKLEDGKPVVWFRVVGAMFVTGE